MKFLLTNQHSEQAFTIVEVIVTMVVVSLFILGFFQTFILLESQRVSVVRQAKASDVAYINLRKYPQKPANLDCTLAAATTGIVLGSTDQSIATSAYSFVPESDTQALGSQSVQTVKAYAPNGCAPIDPLNPLDPLKFQDGLVKIVSTVTYPASFGGGGNSVTHVSYVK